MGELRKQIIDQWAHTLWGLATGSAPAIGMWALGRPGLVFGVALACGSGWLWTRRERLQFRNGAHIWWDPVLDNSVFWAGVAVGLFLTMLWL
jgi:hypothetical protein